jgi:hypothetical protein
MDTGSGVRADDRRTGFARPGARVFPQDSVRRVRFVSGSCRLRSASRRAAHAQVPMVIANIGTIRHQSEAGFSDPGLCQICQVRVNIASRPDRDFGLAVGNAEVREKLDAPQGFEP